MSHYKEYKMRLIDKEEFELACRQEFAGEEDDRERYGEFEEEAEE